MTNRKEFATALRALTALACFSATTVLAQAPDPVKEPDAVQAPAALPETPALAVTEPVKPPEPPRRADFKDEIHGDQARNAADTALQTRDAEGRPFAIVDKIAARVYVFDAEGRLVGAAPALLGIAIGDHIAEGVGNMDLSRIPLKDRTTPAGRFKAALGKNYHGKQILWVDYDSALSMHPVINTVPSERRPQRLASPSPLDNRISFGCINLPIPFFKDVITSVFKDAGGIVYILPELLSGEARAVLKSPVPTSAVTKSPAPKGRNTAGR
jgi:hypothetical protein